MATSIPVRINVKKSTDTDYKTHEVVTLSLNLVGGSTEQDAKQQIEDFLLRIYSAKRNGGWNSNFLYAADRHEVDSLKIKWNTQLGDPRGVESNENVIRITETNANYVFKALAKANSIIHSVLYVDVIERTEREAELNRIIKERELAHEQRLNGRA